MNRVTVEPRLQPFLLIGVLSFSTSRIEVCLQNCWSRVLIPKVTEGSSCCMNMKRHQRPAGRVCILESVGLMLEEKWLQSHLSQCRNRAYI